MKKKILVTGSAGYIGSHLAYGLLKNKNYKIDIIDNLSNSNINVIKKIKNKFPKQVKFYKLNLSNFKKINSIFIKNKYDIVIHLAAKINAEESFKKKKIYKKINLDVSKKIFKLCKKNKVKNIIFASSAAVYGNVKVKKVSEKHDSNPINPYGKFKLLSEKNLISIVKKDMNYAILRFFNVAGISSHFKNNFKNRSSIFFKLDRHIQNKSKIFKVYKSKTNTKDGSCERDFIHILDIVKIIKILINKKKYRLLLNCGTGENYSILNVINKFEKITNYKINFKMEKFRQGDPSSVISDNKLLKKTLSIKKFKNLKNICNDFS